MLTSPPAGGTGWGVRPGMNGMSGLARRPASWMRPAVLFLCIAAISLSLSGVEGLMVKQDLSSLAQRSDDIVLGTIVGTESSWNADHTGIVTTAHVRINRSTKQRFSGTISVTVPGGTTDGLTQWVEDQPVLVPGTEAFFFLAQHPRWGTTFAGGDQGMLHVRNGRVMSDGTVKSRGIPVDDFDRFLSDVSVGIPAALPVAAGPEPRAAAATPVISSISPSTASAGTGTLVTITGTGFGTKASRTSSADVGFLYRYTSSGATAIWASGYPYFSENSNDIISWSDTRIVVRVPTGRTSDQYLGGASSGYVVVWTDSEAVSAKKPFTVTFGYGKRKWITPATFYVNPGTRGSTAVSAIQNAANTWNAVIPGSSFRFDYRGTSTSTTFGRNNQNLICFGPSSDFTEEGIIAWASSWSDASGNILEADVEFNSQWAWTTGTASGDMMNIEAIVLHELGHWLSLRDLYGWAPGYPSDVGKVMFGFNNDQFGNKNLRSLHEGDRAGIRWIYGSSTAPAPTVSSITPATGVQGSTVVITGVFGTGFQPGATVKLQQLGSADIPATAVSIVSSTRITCQFTLPAAASGTWAVVVMNPDGRSGSLASGFSITALASSLSADFSANPTSGPAPLSVQFTDISTGSPVIRFWSFGDGSTSTQVSPSHTYIAPGTYTVSLTVYNSAGQSNSKTLAGLVTVGSTTSSEPWYVPHVLPARIEAEDYDTSGPGNSYWDTTAANEGGAYRSDGVDIERLSSGGYAVCYIREGEWTVYTVESPADTAYPVELRVSRWYDTARTVEILVDSVRQGTVTVPKTGSSAVYTTVSTLVPVPAGRHTVTLRFHGGSMNIDSITFGAPPQPPAFSADFSASPTSGPAPLSVQFTDSSTGTPTSWTWSFGDGETSSERHPRHSYANPGIYTVSLSVGDATGQSRTKTSAGLVTVSGASTAPWYIPHVLPARIEAEDYDTSGPGTAYWDTTAVNEGRAYRTDGVDIERISTGGYAVCFIREGEWTRYTVESPADTTYPVELRVSRWYDTARTVEIFVDSVRQGTVTVPKTGSSTAYTTVSTLVPVPAGRHTVTLRYHGGSMNIDSFTFGSPGPSSPPGTPLGDAVDAPDLSWNSDGASPWTAQQSFSHDGSDAARSGSVANGQRSRLSTQVTGPAMVSWWWRTSSEAEFDHLNLLVDGQIRQVLSGESGWEESSTTVGPGAHTVAWEFVKDPTYAKGSDCGWLDQVRVASPADGRTADFGSSAICGRAPLSVQFTDGSTGGPTTWAWSFGDGGTSNLQNPTHTYASNGFFTVSLRATYADGATRTMTRQWFIHTSSYF